MLLFEKDVHIENGHRLKGADVFGFLPDSSLRSINVRIWVLGRPAHVCDIIAPGYNTPPPGIPPMQNPGGVILQTDGGRYAGNLVADIFDENGGEAIARIFIRRTTGRELRTVIISPSAMYIADLKKGYTSKRAQDEALVLVLLPIIRRPGIIL